MPFSGNVETIPLDEVFQFIADNTLEGALTVAGGGARITVHFVEGQVFFPFSARRGTYSLGKILRQTGLLSREALEKQMNALRQARAAELEKLEKSASQEQVEAARRKQFEEEIHDAFLWRRAYFEFAPGRLPDDVQKQRVQGKGVTLDPTAFLMEVARRADERRRIRRAIPSGRVVLECVGSSAADVEKALTARGIVAEGAACGIDGTRSLEDLLELWGVPHHDALAGLAPLVEGKRIRPISLDAAGDAYEKALGEGDVGSAARYVAHLCELGPSSEGCCELGDEKGLIESAAWRDGGDARLAARFHGTRAFAIAHILIVRGATFSLRAFEDGRERLIVATGDSIALRATHDDATPTLGRYLRRAGTISEADLKQATAQSEKDGRPVGDILLRAGKVTHDDWIHAALEKLSDEVASIALSPEVDIELCNRARLPEHQQSGPKKELAQAISLSIPLDDGLRQKLAETMARWDALVREVPGEDAIFFPGDKSGDGDPAAKFFARFDGKRSVGVLRRVAKAEPLEFMKFIQGGLKRRYVRAPEREELEQTLAQAMEAGDDARAYRLACAGVAFGMSEPFVGRVKELKARDAAPSPDTRPSIEGDMEGIGLAAVLQGLRGGKRTGTLAITDGKRESKIYFHRGCVFLLKLEDKEAQEFVDFFLESDDGGEVAPSLAGSVDEKSLDQTEARKLKEEALDVLFWEKARFTFRKNELPEDFHAPPQGAMKVALDTDKFLIEAIRRIEEWDHIKRAIPSGATILAFGKPEAKLAAIRAGDNTEVLTILDGRHSFDDVVRISGTPRLEVGRFLRGLVEKGDVVVLEPAAKAG